MDVSRRAVLVGVIVATVLVDLAMAQSGSGRIFEPVARVLASPRCINCHPSSATPRQGDAARVHVPRVARGPDGRGNGLACASCHREANDIASGVPGAVGWSLAPASMAWEGLDAGALCRTLKDRSRNGDRDLSALVAHMDSDTRVNWAWSPGGRRTPPPLGKADFMSALRAWEAAGGPCPD